MPPSTVFSYWRREYRRSTASPVSPPAQPNSKVSGPTNAPLQLPVISDPTTLKTTAPGDPPTSQSPADCSPEFERVKGGVAVSTINAASSSTTTLVVPDSSTSDNHVRPRSSPEESERDSSLTTQSNYSQPSLPSLLPEQSNGDSSKPSSPFRRSFGNSKRSSISGMAPSSNLRFRASPDQSPAEKTPSSHKEYRYDGLNNRRQGDRDPQAEHPHKSGKAMFHLLNPMSLLAKRRSSQIAGLRAEDMNIGARNLVPAIPDDYDPRIRGNIVHDFSAPRPRRHLSAAPVLIHGSSNSQNVPESSQISQLGNEPNALGGSDFASLGFQGPELRKRQSEYSPVFKEHFEDDERVLQIENKAYLQSTLLTDPSHLDNAHSIPVFARKLPSMVTDQEYQPDGEAKPNQSTKPSPLIQDSSNVSQDSDTIEIVPNQPSGLPKHFKSNASRFSFDMNGVESSTQEKLLEEKHKEKEAARRAQARLEDQEFSDVDDNFDHDLLDDLDDFEEKIPGVNVDADYDDDDDYNDEFSGFSGPGNILNKSWLAPDLSPVMASPVYPKPEVQQVNPLPSSGAEFTSLDYTAAFPEREAISLEDQVSAPRTLSVVPQSVSTGLSQLIEEEDEDEDDLYFDDGEFGDLNADDAGDKFDESIFDDETSHLYDRKRTSEPVAPDQATKAEPTNACNDSTSEPEDFILESGLNGLKHVPSMASDYREIGVRKFGSVAEGVPNPPAKAFGGVLSEHNLEALHNALADAANQAANKGRLGHTTSVSEHSQGQESISQTVDSHPGLVSDDSRLSQAVDMMTMDEVFEDFNYDDYDDSLYDDPIIAAANAEALENDDEGFYGQEFGFYAHAYGNSSELMNGGYFGPRGVEGISRSHSGRGKFREPSLTPITERSEWSTRNSIISVNAHGAGPSVSSPGLAQLVDMGNLDDEMSLGALMKLRRGAWGGSNGSLRSSSRSPPPHPHSTSNRGSFTLSDVSPTVHTAPPDILGGASAIDSPIRESEKGGPWPSSLPSQYIGENGEPQTHLLV